MLATDFGPGEAGLDQGEPGLHEDDQGGAQQDEHVVQVHLDGVDLRFLGNGRCRQGQDAEGGQAGPGHQLPAPVSAALRGVGE